MLAIQSLNHCLYFYVASIQVSIFYRTHCIRI